MLERYLIEHCSPTLASMKTASLFSCGDVFAGELAKELALWNVRLEDKGVCLTLLQNRDGPPLVYVYRKSALRRDLRLPEVTAFLVKYGYRSMETEYAIARLGRRLMEGGTFPHEIGIFLGYPLGDVVGFIENGGERCKCSGYWKVYCDEQGAERSFARFRKCARVYACLWQKGKSVRQLTVAA